LELGSLKKIYIYTEPRCPQVDFSEIEAFIEDLVGPTPVETRGPLLESNLVGPGGKERLESLAVELSRAKVRDLDAPANGAFRPLPGEIDYERRRLANGRNPVFGILYDAFLLCGTYRGMLGGGRSHSSRLNIVFTNQLIGTWDVSDRRYHARTVLLGSPAIISVSGLVEAPARAPGFYLARRSAEALGLGEEEKLELARTFADDCLDHDDQRLTEVAKGYAAQAVAYHLSGEPFCDDPDCRLFNAHRQSELLNAQLSGESDFCQRHQEMLNN
jgi:hypothetical protein